MNAVVLMLFLVVGINELAVAVSLLTLRHRLMLQRRELEQLRAEVKLIGDRTVVRLDKPLPAGTPMFLHYETDGHWRPGGSMDIDGFSVVPGEQRSYGS